MAGHRPLLGGGDWDLLRGDHHGTSPELGNLRHANHSPSLMFYLLLALTMLLIIVPLLFRLFATIDRNIRRH